MRLLTSRKTDMLLLGTGLLLFFGCHVVTSIPPLRKQLVGSLTPQVADETAASVGVKRYRGLFSLCSLVGLVCIIGGYASAAEVVVRAPQAWAIGVSKPAMLVALVLMAAANMPTHTRTLLRHPMLIGVSIWALVHFFANGSASDSLLFGSFLLYSIYAIISAELRHKLADPGKTALRYDLLAAGAGGLAFAILLYAHGYLFGVAVTG